MYCPIIYKNKTSYFKFQRLILCIRISFWLINSIASFIFPIRHFLLLLLSSEYCSIPFLFLCTKYFYVPYGFLANLAAMFQLKLFLFFPLCFVKSSQKSALDSKREFYRSDWYVHRYITEKWKIDDAVFSGIQLNTYEYF